jgi:hypothetical protein
MYNQQRLKKVALMLMMSMLCLISFAQERQVQGIVKDKSGEPMIGVNVLVKGTTNGTIQNELPLCSIYLYCVNIVFSYEIIYFSFKINRLPTTVNKAADCCKQNSRQ